MNDGAMDDYADRDALFASFATHLAPGKARLYREYGLDVSMGERRGPHFHDRYDGRRFFNCHVNGGVFNLGHRNPSVLEAVRRALEEVDIGNHHLASPYRARLAERLAASTDGALPGVVFGVGGGESVDLALSLARGVTGRPGVVSALGGYHGHTGLSRAAGDAQYREPFGAALPHFRQVPFDDLDALDAAVGDDTAAVILEPIPATLGMPIPSEGYLAGVQRLCRERGALFVVDEVQTGLGRTGALYAHRLDDLAPDMMVLGKGLSGGVYPITATLMRAELLAFFEAHPFAHISTFGGAEPGCAAALSVLDQLEAPGFLERVRALGERFERGLGGLPFHLRRRGLMMGFAFDAPDGGMLAAHLLYARGVFTAWANNDTRVLQFLPPLILSDAETDELIATVRGVFGG